VKGFKKQSERNLCKSIFVFVLTATQKYAGTIGTIGTKL
jgi:hypothetical protein